MDYTVVSADSLGSLIKMVNEYINEGWRPQGGVAIVTLGQVRTWINATIKAGYYQAMIQDE